MSKHRPELVLCRKQTGVGIGRVCERCDGKCVLCDSHVNRDTEARVCDACSLGPAQNRCVVCASPADAQTGAIAFYCAECCILERDREGCPRVLNAGATKGDILYSKSKFK